MTFPPRILLLDESETDIKVIKDVLNDNGQKHSLYNVTNKTDYLLALKQYKPDIVITENKLATLSGLEAISLLKNQAPNTPILLVTRNPEQDTAHAYISAGASDYINKEDLTKLLPTIKSTLAMKNHSQENENKNLFDYNYAAQFEMILDTMDNAFLVVYDENGIYQNIWGNSPILKNNGFDKNSLIGQSISIFYSPKDAIQRIQYIKEVFATGKTLRHTVLVNSPVSKEKFWLQITLSPIRDKNNTIIAVAGFLLDISKRLNAEQELKRLATAFEQVAECIVITDTNGNIEFVNQVVEKVTGYTREELLNQNCRIFKSDKHDEKFYKNMWRTILSGEIWNGHLYNKKKDDTIYEEEVTISPIRDKQGLIKNYVAVKRDVTNEVKMEKQLRQAQKMEAIGTLAGGIAHDFNNILAAILGYTELSLRDLDHESKLYKHLQQVLQAGYRAKDLIKQILAFSRQSQQEIKPLQISLIIKEALKLLRASLPTTIEMRQNLKAHNSLVLADPTQIHQVVMNLCTNAAHAMRHKGGILAVNMYQVEISEQDVQHYHGLTPGPYLKLSISDTGHGMTPEIVERVFEPYFTTKKQGEGTGMGLSVVHGIIKSHNGDITVYSEIGKGTAFNVLLPCLESGEQKKEEKSNFLPHGSERIMFVDDEETLVEIGQEMLEQLGYHVIAKTNSMEAFELFHQNPQDFDMIITDQTMPYMTGAELSRKALDIRPNIPIILCTGFSEVITEEKAKKIGIDEFIMKPIFMKEIAFVIRRLLDHEPVGEKT